MTLVGVPATPHPSPQVFHLVGKRRALAGSMIGGIPETREMLDFCAEHDIVADIEMIRADQVNEAYERMLASDVKYRFVMENATLGDVAEGRFEQPGFQGASQKLQIGRASGRERGCQDV